MYVCMYEVTHILFCSFPTLVSSCRMSLRFRCRASLMQDCPFVSFSRGSQPHCSRNRTAGSRCAFTAQNSGDRLLGSTR